MEKMSKAPQTSFPLKIPTSYKEVNQHNMLEILNREWKLKHICATQKNAHIDPI